MNLVTGGSGFVGGHIVEYLVEEGESVRVFDRVEPEVCRDEIEYVDGDVRNPADVSEAVDGVETIYHNIALVPVTKAGEEFWDVNVTGTERMLEAARSEGVDHFVHLSSSSIYSLASLPITEESELSAKGPYSASKLEADDLVLSQSTVPATVIRPRTVVGERRAGIFQILFDWIRRGKRVYTVGRGDNTFQMVSGRDLARACVLATRTERSVGEVYNVGAGEFGTMREAYDDLIEYADTGSSVTGLPRLPTKAGMAVLDKLDLSPLTTFHYKTIDKDFYFDIAKAKSHLDWRPEHSNADCMRRGYDWFCEHREEATVESDSETGSGHRKMPDQGVLKILRRFS